MSPLLTAPSALTSERKLVEVGGRRSGSVFEGRRQNLRPDPCWYRQIGNLVGPRHAPVRCLPRKVIAIGLPIGHVGKM